METLGVQRAEFRGAESRQQRPIWTHQGAVSKSRAHAYRPGGIYFKYIIFQVKSQQKILIKIVSKLTLLSKTSYVVAMPKGEDYHAAPSNEFGMV